MTKEAKQTLTNSLSALAGVLLMSILFTAVMGGCTPADKAPPPSPSARLLQGGPSAPEPEPVPEPTKLSALLEPYKDKTPPPGDLSVLDNYHPDTAVIEDLLQALTDLAPGGVVTRQSVFGMQKDWMTDIAFASLPSPTLQADGMDVNEFSVFVGCIPAEYFEGWVGSVAVSKLPYLRGTVFATSDKGLLFFYGIGQSTAQTEADRQLHQELVTYVQQLATGENEAFTLPRYTLELVEDDLL